MRLPSKDSATWRAIITGLQTFCGFLVALIALPDFSEIVQQFYPEAVPIIVTGAGVASFVLNFFRKSVKNY